MIRPTGISRRRFLAAALAVLPAFHTRRLIAACQVTEEDSLGPFYVPGAPLQNNLCQAGAGEPVTIAGRVLGLPDCRPLAGALLEVWQADATGRYTLVTAGEKPDSNCLFRASIKTDEAGRYSFRTILPGLYPGRPRHIHYRVSHPGFATLVTQLYFKADSVSSRVGSRAVELRRDSPGTGKTQGYSGVFEVILRRAGE